MKTTIKNKIIYTIPVGHLSKKESSELIKKYKLDYNKEIDFDASKRIQRENTLMDIFDIHGPRQTKIVMKDVVDYFIPIKSTI